MVSREEQERGPQSQPAAGGNKVEQGPPSGRLAVTGQSCTHPAPAKAGGTLGTSTTHGGALFVPLNDLPLSDLEENTN